MLVHSWLGRIEPPALANLLWDRNLFSQSVVRCTLCLHDSLGLNYSIEFLVQSVGTLEDGVSAFPQSLSDLNDFS